MHNIFKSLEKKDVVMWTSMINGLAIHDHGNEAFSMFQIMQVDSVLYSLIILLIFEFFMHVVMLDWLKRLKDNLT